MFVDEAVIKVRAGRGGDGCSAFHREKYRPFGGPSGGDGGHGGSVVLRATHRASTLLEVSSHPHLHAENGRPGGPKRMTGRSGADLVVEVPRGTLVRSTGESPALLCDLTSEGSRYIAAGGGRGGRGNARFATSVNQAPRECEPGAPGQERSLALELKLLADVGLIGLPSAGKSTLIARVSAARPKIAAYPFTTLSPVLGIVSLGDMRSCVMADLPGLIEGAHEGVGLGIQFLKHVERTRLLVHVIDAEPLDGRDPWDAYQEIRNELALYSSELLLKPELIVLAKMDLPGASASLEGLRRAIGDRLPVHPFSSVTGKGLKGLLGAIARELARLAEEASGA